MALLQSDLVFDHPRNVFLFAWGKGKKKGVEACSSGTNHSTSDSWHVCSPVSHSQILLLNFSKEVQQI